MIKLTPKGEALFRATQGYSISQIMAVQSIAYEEVTRENFEDIVGLDPLRGYGVFEELIKKELIKEI